MRVAWVFVLMAFLIGGAVLAWVYFEDRDRPDISAPNHVQSNAAAARDSAREINRVADFFAQEAIDVTAKELRRAYQANEVAAREKYLGRPLRIDGHVERVAVESVGGKEFPVVYFREGGACTFNWGERQPELSKLKPGQRVTLLGQPRGADVPDRHLTTHCSIVEYYE